MADDRRVLDAWRAMTPRLACPPSSPPFETEHRSAPMDRLLERLHDLAREHFPHGCCLPCLATRLGVDEKHLRDAAQIAVGSRSLILKRRVCRACLETVECLMAPDYR
jgi:hypothetical protein